MGTLPNYATREEFQRALDYADTARDAAAIDRALSFGSRKVERDLHRFFYPMSETRYRAFPDTNTPTSWRLWLDEDEVLSVSSLTAGGVAIDPADYFLEPLADPPYNRVELDRSSNASFTAGDTEQRNVAITGVFGFCADTRVVGTHTEDLDATETDVSVSDSSLVGVGDAILIGSEYMVVTGRGWASTSQTLQTNMDVKVSDTTVDVTTGSAFNVDEYLVLDAETMLITAVVGNLLVVKRAVNGSVLAAHTAGATVYASRTLTVVRGCLGTTAAVHATGGTVLRHVAPSPIRAMALAEAVNLRFQESSGFARTVGSGDNLRNATGAGLESMREAVYWEYARKGRTRAI